jgi:hypothetical protein
MRVFYVALFESGIRRIAGSSKIRRRYLFHLLFINDMRAGSALSHPMPTLWKNR